MRRMEAAPGEGSGGEAARTSAEESAVSAGAVGEGMGADRAAWETGSDAAARPGRMAASGTLTWQQAWFVRVGEGLQPFMPPAILWQQAWFAVGWRQAMAGVAIQKIATARRTSAPFLPICIV